MKRRLATAVLRARLARFPAAALLGPRQSGKTTLARSLSRRYYDAEQPADRVRLDLNWEAITSGHELVVIDEAQNWPELFPRLRAAIDASRRRNGRFLLLGSVSPVLMREVSESLAGRLARVELTPFLLPELGKHALARLWLNGGFPDGGALHGRRFPVWQRDYLALMAQRDLPAWGLPARPQVTDRLLHMLAVAHGQLWNASAVGQSLGLSYHTVNGYLDYLEGAYLIRRLSPWSGNLRKRLTRSPKVYLRDTGLLHALLRIGSRTELLRHPAAGASWEGFGRGRAGKDSSSNNCSAPSPRVEWMPRRISCARATATRSICYSRCEGSRWPSRSSSRPMPHPRILGVSSAPRTWYRPSTGMLCARQTNRWRMARAACSISPRPSSG
ncbi:MAG: ATP-binding protein [Betaproteobacteria bacterium]|nr:ATP-binding protein [Betaproteobacteria bacterium]